MYQGWLGASNSCTTAGARPRLCLCLCLRLCLPCGRSEMHMGLVPLCMLRGDFVFKLTNPARDGRCGSKKKDERDMERYKEQLDSKVQNV